MKPIVIDSKFIKREHWILLGCFIAAVIFAVVAAIAVVLFNARRRKTRGPY